ncbi:SDR family NAD(P)-dependent oxidoreductase [Paenibacillus sp. URB8-2]|uniref:SDR family NAD(P)-dependent oxidoreductase n=1 Tax=Paenibacillus sp. URB8-2 TaxID=2741301 RepID=UPI0015C0C1F7|nr:SDR family oxidoreductase [Paenibacillus sp. URB8-2]BCG61596.1 short-chain dehydrogenase [Paenibacillus sp. URB8-2]
MKPTVLITGASSGIGLAFATLFASRHYDIVLVARRADRLNELAEQLSREYGSLVTVIPSDLSLPDAPRDIFEQLRSRKIDIDILVNNAGTQVYGEFQHADLEATLRLIQINIMALTELTKLATDDMVRKGRKGKILNVGSTGSFAPSPLNAVYCATKAYVLSFSEGISKDLEGTGITVTTLCPGATRSEFAEKANLLDSRLFNFAVMEPEKVASIGYKALMNNKRVAVPGLLNRLMVGSIPFTPRGLLLRLSHYLMRPAR